MKNRFLATALAVTLACLPLAACGNDDDSSAAPRSEDIPADAGDADENGDSGSEAGSVSGDVDAVDHSSLSDVECLKIGNALTGIFGRGIIGDFDEDMATFRSFAAGAPADTQGDFDTFLGAYESSYKMLDDAGIALNNASDVMDNQETVNAATEMIETPEVESAIAVVENVFFEACPMMNDQS